MASACWLDLPDDHWLQNGLSLRKDVRAQDGMRGSPSVSPGPFLVQEAFYFLHQGQHGLVGPQEVTWFSGNSLCL
jgi:hypothetical protein